MHLRHPLIPLLAMAVVLALGLGLPLIATPDCDCGLTTEQERRLKIHARQVSSLPALRLQIVEASAPGPDPDSALGTVVVRAPFAVETRKYDFHQDGGTFSYSHRRELLAWSALFLGLATPATWLFKILYDG
jgi:hypothetical protein